MFKKLENKIKELALRIHDSRLNNSKSIYEDSKRLYELTVIHKYLKNQERDADWLLHEERLKETLRYFKTLWDFEGFYDTLRDVERL